MTAAKADAEALNARSGEELRCALASWVQAADAP